MKYTFGFVIALAVGAAPALAGVTPIARLSELHVQGQLGEQAIDQNLTFAEFGQYDNLLSKVAGNEGSNQVRARAEQSSNVDISLPQRINVSGLLQADASVLLVANDLTSPTFIAGGTEVTVDFRVTEQAAFVNTSGEFDHLGVRGIDSSITISGIDVPAGETPFNLVIDNELSLTFIRNFMLEPGTYRMAAHTGAGSSGSSAGDPFSDSQTSEMNFVFAVSAQGPAAIPLPAGVLPGALMLIATQVGMIVQRRMARAAQAA